MLRRGAPVPGRSGRVASAHTCARQADEGSNVAFIEWTSEYDMGIEEIDRQHRRLAEIVNRLRDAMEQSCPRAPMQGILCDLLAFVELHFAHEERLMRQMRFAGGHSHRLAHRALTGEVQQFEVALANGEVRGSFELTERLKSWLLSEEVPADRLLAGCTRGRVNGR